LNLGCCLIACLILKNHIVGAIGIKRGIKINKVNRFIFYMMTKHIEVITEIETVSTHIGKKTY